MTAEESGRGGGASWRTPLPTLDPEHYLPELAAVRRVTTRLHPRPGDPGVFDSSLGGPLRWPASDPLPVCEVDHADDGDDGPVPLIPVLQLFRRDVPSLVNVDWPEGAELLQVLWCPRDHDDPGWWPLPRLVWRRRAELESETVALPAARVVDETLHPAPCVLHPEPGVVEYTMSDAPPGFWPPLRERGEEFQEKTGLRFGSHLTVAPGTKLGGWPNWHQPPYWPECECGGRPVYFLSVQTYEFDGGEAVRWVPFHDQDMVTRFYRDRDSVDFEVFEAARNPHGLQIGRSGGLHLFLCVQCPGTPLLHWADDT